jgi:SAM-dependent methyltransferase
MSSLKRYNRWIWDGIAPYIGSRVLEVGSGIGNMTRLLYGRDLIVATDMEKAYLDILRNRFLRNPTIEVDRCDLESDADAERLQKHSFDSVVCLNVLEHIEDDRGALQRIKRMLTPGGHVLLFVPADQKLFGTMDTQVGHYRRYSRETLEAVMREAGFEIVKMTYQNVFGRFGWWLNGQVLRRQHLPAGQSKMFDYFVPLMRAIEPKSPKNGLSLVAVGRKPASEAGGEISEAV